MLEERDGSREDCVAPQSLLAVVEGSAAEAARLETLRHVGACPHCRAELDLLRTTADASKGVTRLDRYRTPLVGAIAATVVLAIGAVSAWWAITRPVGSEAMRSLTPAAVQLLSPSADAAVAAPVTLVWSAVESARQYDVEMLDAAGTAVFDATTSDTTVVVPAEALVAGVDYRWWVRAEVPGGTRPSLMRRLRVTTR